MVPREASGRSVLCTADRTALATVPARGQIEAHVLVAGGQRLAHHLAGDVLVDRAAACATVGAGALAPPWAGTTSGIVHTGLPPRPGAGQAEDAPPCAPPRAARRTASPSAGPSRAAGYPYRANRPGLGWAVSAPPGLGAEVARGDAGVGRMLRRVGRAKDLDVGAHRDGLEHRGGRGLRGGQLDLDGVEARAWSPWPGEARGGGIAWARSDEGCRRERQRSHNGENPSVRT